MNVTTNQMEGIKAKIAIIRTISTIDINYDLEKLQIREKVLKTKQSKILEGDKDG